MDKSTAYMYQPIIPISHPKLESPLTTVIMDVGL